VGWGWGGGVLVVRMAGELGDGCGDGGRGSGCSSSSEGDQRWLRSHRGPSFREAPERRRGVAVLCYITAAPLR